MSTLIVDLTAALHSARPELLHVLSQDGVSLSRQGRCTADLLPSATEVVGVLPAGVLSWHLVSMPPSVRRHAGRDPARLRTVLFGLMEEQLLDDPDACHLATFEHSDDALLVAVCQLAPVRQALQLLETQGCPVTRLVPALSPTAQVTLYALDEPQAQVVLTHPHGVLSLPATDSAWRFMLAQTPLRVLAEAGQVAPAQQKTSLTVELQTPAQRLLAAASSPLNLAQHNLALSRRMRWQKRLGRALADVWQTRAWRPARIALGLLVGINLLGVGWLAREENAALQAKQTQSAQLLQATFPEVQLVVDAPLQMARSLALLQQGQSAHLKLALDTLARTAPEARLSGLVFSGPEVRWQGLALDAGQTRSLQAALKAAGVQAEVLAGGDWVLRAGSP
jgi:general secretion pathway protein L